MDDAMLLYVSDDPERFLDHGRLFDAPLAAGVDRFLFDHVNGMTIPMRVIAFVSNVGSQPAQLSNWGVAGDPDTNGMAAGHEATSRFLYGRESLNSTAVSSTVIADGEHAVLANAILSPEQCFTGIFDLEVPPAASLRLRVIACDPVHTEPNIFSALPAAPDDGAQRRGVFDISNAQAIDIAWSQGSSETEIGRALHTRWQGDPYSGPPLKGEYGVIRRITWTFSNPEQSPSSFAIYGTPRAGSATGSFIVDDECIGSHSVQEFERFKIIDGVLAPGESRAVKLVTMPDINSSYPFAFTVGQNDDTVASAFSSSSPLYQGIA